MANDFPGMIFVVKAEKGFKDGNVYPRRISVNEIVEVDFDTFLKMQQSDPESIHLIEKRIPRAKPAPKVEVEEPEVKTQAKPSHKAKAKPEAKETPQEEG